MSRYVKMSALRELELHERAVNCRVTGEISIEPGRGSIRAIQLFLFSRASPVAYLANIKTKCTRSNYLIKTRHFTAPETEHGNGSGFHNIIYTRTGHIRY